MNHAVPSPADYSERTRKALALTDPDKINYDLVEAVLAWLADGDHQHPKTGSILVSEHRPTRTAPTGGVIYGGAQEVMSAVSFLTRLGFVICAQRSLRDRALWGRRNDNKR